MHRPDQNPSFPAKLTKYFVAAFLAGLVVIAVIPNFMRATLSKASNPCVANLRQIDGAKQQWFLENDTRSKDVPNDAELAVCFKHSRLPTCPLGGKYTVGRKDEVPKCSIGDSAWPNNHVLHTTNSWWKDFKAAYQVVLGNQARPVGR